MVQREDHGIDGQRLDDVDKDEVRYIEYMLVLGGPVDNEVKA